MGLFRAAPTLSAEIACWRQGYRHVAGLDEAGRGPLAGPVVAAAVVLDPDVAQVWWADLRDSKQLPAPRREEFAARIRETADVAVGVASHEEIDRLGIVPATRLAMGRALIGLPCRPGHLLVDALSLPDVDLPQRAIVHGDALSASIAAASIVAKVTRDRMMDEFHARYPDYGFDRNRGYATASHMRALAEYGPCPIHRRRFEPVRRALAGELVVVR